MTTDVEVCCDLAWFYGAGFALAGVVVGAVAVWWIESRHKRRPPD